MEDNYIWNRIHKLLISSFAEATGFFIFIAFTTGLISGLLRFIFRGLLVRLGIENVEFIHSEWKWIGQNLIMSMQEMKADRVCFYTIQNGKPYFDNVEWNDLDLKNIINDLKKTSISFDLSDYFIEQNFKIESNKTNKVRNRGINYLPDSLEINGYKKMLLQVIECESIGEFFPDDLGDYEYLKKVLLEYGIKGYILVKIDSLDKTKTYGFVIYTYSNIKTMPVLIRQSEHLSEVKTAITYAYENILNRNWKRKIKNLKEIILTWISLRFYFRNKNQDRTIFLNYDNISLYNIKEVEEILYAKIESSKESLEIVLKKECLIDSSGIGLLFRVSQINKIKFNKKIKLINLSSKLKRVFDIAKINTIMEY